MNGVTPFETTPNTDLRRVAYYYDPDVGLYHYYLGHPMKPHRIRMAHNLIVNYGLCDESDSSPSAEVGEGSRALNDPLAGAGVEDGVAPGEERMAGVTEHRGGSGKAMQIFRPRRATKDDMTKFHSDEFIEVLEKVNPDNQAELTGGGMRALTGDDCPGFEGLWEFCQISAGGSLGAADRINSGAADIAINWAGGLHHSKKTEASGFCYVNDIVLGILELLRIHPRVLYIDVDVHHGDGVEEAFYTTDRVMTASFHRFGEFFPGTGDVRDVGMKKGKGYSVNVPFRDGITNESFHALFKPIIRSIIEWYRPGAIVLQLGADSLSGDKIGGFNLTLDGHGECASFVRSFGIPTIMLGGGGYTIKNVARAWTNETALACGKTLDEDLPYNQYMEYYGPRYKLEVLSTNAADHNPPEYLERIKQTVIENLRDMPFAPSVQNGPVPEKLSKILGMKNGELDDPDDEVDRRVRKYLRRKNQNGGYASSSSSEDEAGPSSRSYRQGGRPVRRSRRPPKRLHDEESVMSEASEDEDPCGVRRKRTFFKSSGFGIGKGLGMLDQRLRVIEGIRSGGSSNGHGHTAATMGGGMHGVQEGMSKEMDMNLALGLGKKGMTGIAGVGAPGGPGGLGLGGAGGGGAEGWKSVSRAGSPMSVV